MDQAKTDHPPLIADSGLFPHTLASLRAMTVDAFPDSTRRLQLFNSLTVYLELLECTGLKAFIWVDGSFMCTKAEPDDIDLVVVYDTERADALPESTWEQITGLLTTNIVKARFGLHVFKVASTDDAALEFWFQKFGTQRDEVTPKGLAELRINHD